MLRDKIYYLPEQFRDLSIHCGAIISINVCIYIYIYMDTCVWVSVCVRGWVAKEGFLSSTCLTGVRVSKGTPLSILARISHRELYPREPARPEGKKDWCWSVRSELLKQRVKHSEVGQSALRRGSRAVGGWYGVKNENSEQWRWWFDELSFLVAV